MTRKRLVLISFALAALLAFPAILVKTAPALGASFDCAKASTEIERAICGDAALSELDSALGAAYLEARSIPRIKDEVTKEQRKWIKTRNESCQGEQLKSHVSLAACLQTQTMLRVMELRRAKGGRSYISLAMAAPASERLSGDTPVGFYEGVSENDVSTTAYIGCSQSLCEIEAYWLHPNTFSCEVSLKANYNDIKNSIKNGTPIDILYTYEDYLAEGNKTLVFEMSFNNNYITINKTYQQNDPTQEEYSFGPFCGARAYLENGFKLFKQL